MIYIDTLFVYPRLPRIQRVGVLCGVQNIGGVMRRSFQQPCPGLEWGSRFKDTAVTLEKSMC
jgi:hypothetical protein